MEPITKDDLILVKNLSSRKYTGNSLRSNATEAEQDHLKKVINKLSGFANYFSEKYSDVYGPFDIGVATGNPIAIGGVKFKTVWAGIFKGASNKQYAAQISFVINSQDTCLDVGFYFGRASVHTLNQEQRIQMKNQLNVLGLSLSDAIRDDSALMSRYSSLFDFGFAAYSNGNRVSPNDWHKNIRTDTKNSQIIAKVNPNDFGIIEASTIDSFVSQIIFLMATIGVTKVSSAPIVIKPLTPEQRAKQEERLAQIGQKGELYVMKHEQDRLANLGIIRDNYPRHVALESMHYGYDILSLNDNGGEIYIEVKTTTRTRDDLNSRKFFLSANELKVFSKNKQSYKIYRVYDVENSPNFDVLNLDHLSKEPDGYIVKY